MQNDKIGTNNPGPQRSDSAENTDEQVLPVHNPLDPGDGRQITQEDIDNEQKYKEALTERD